MKRAAAIVGIGMSKFRTRRDDVDFLGLLQEGAGAALASAGLDMTDIGLVVLAQSPDALHGLGHPEQAAAAALGVNGKPIMRVNTGGATGASAAQAGWWAVVSGRFEAVLVVGAEKMGDATKGAQEVLNKIWDPRYESALPLNTITMTALQAVRYMHETGATEEHFASIASRTRSAGARNENAHLREALTPEEVMRTPVLAWPTRRAMACPRSSGACGIVVVSEGLAKRLSAPRAWIRGMTARTNTYFMGDKMGDCAENDHAYYNDVRLACAELYEMGGIKDPATEIDVVEPYVPFSPMEPAILEAMGLCQRGEAVRLEEQGHWDLGGNLPVCPSGGTLCANPISVSALARVAEAANQVRGTAREHQVNGAKVAFAGGIGGSVQFFVTALLASDSAMQ